MLMLLAAPSAKLEAGLHPLDDEVPRLPRLLLPLGRSLTAVASAAAAGADSLGLLRPPLRSPPSLALLPKDIRRMRRLRFEASFALGEPDWVRSERMEEEEEDGVLRPALTSVCSGDCVLPIVCPAGWCLLRACRRLRGVDRL